MLSFVLLKPVVLKEAYNHSKKEHSHNAQSWLVIKGKSILLL